MKSAAIIFSGGALRGVAQFGALEAIEIFMKRKNIVVKAVAGSSFGSISASFLSLGYTASEMVHIARKTGFKLFSLRDINLFGSSVLKGKKITSAFEKYFAEKTFKDANCELFINAVDLHSGKELVFTKRGIECLRTPKLLVKRNFKITDALLASTAIPAILKPKKIDDFEFLDGALVSPVGLGLIDYSKYDYVFVIDVSMANLTFVSKNSNLKRMDIIGQAISIVQRELYEHKLKNLLPHKKNVFFIRPNIKPVRKRSKEELETLISAGFQEAKKVLKL
ncbi:MAG: patatin-like phospholipase family protein [Nanoarchaeota archaeon]|nr:patatin-like phospholipase family protein [Nanoarchaeota archaeon]MBU1855043.1 patatin-like phospholipase family protein [Nanoarchaeota archaeon]